MVVNDYEKERYLYLNVDCIFFYIFFLFTFPELAKYLNDFFVVEILGFIIQDLRIVLHSCTILSTSIIIQDS